MIKKGQHVQINFVSDGESRKLNKAYSGKDYPTDVLSFNYQSNKSVGEDLAGEVYVNVDQAKRQCAEYGNSLEEEIAALAEHGILHLLGVHHEGDG